ncbi:MAG: YfhO family protein [Chloroflexi bacterium]|nr:YfhO family protein [Chloroflexota bacterium]
MRKRLLTADTGAVALLLALWALFFWRLLTPNVIDQASLVNGDFSGQFVAFGAYQYQRLTVGQIPLWNPYNNSGLPFIADTQAAVFYPPRLLTIALSAVSGSWTYHALEIEMMAHVLLYTLLFYTFARRLTGSVYGACVAAIIAGYGGFITGYPPLQLALLEASVWLPLAALGILQGIPIQITGTAGGQTIRWRWLALAGFALGLSWMAGHPQTSWFLTYLLVAYAAYRLYAGRYRWQTLIVCTALLGAIAGGIAAVQLLPTFEYIGRTARSEFAFDAKGGGFPFQDVAQMLFPGTVSTWSPLYIGLPGLALALLALTQGTQHEKWFWGGVALFALLWSLGARSPVYPLFYSILPGANVFRGQERAAFLFANALALLAGMGAAWLISSAAAINNEARRGLLRTLRAALWAILALAALVFALWLGNPPAYSSVGIFARSALVALATYALLTLALREQVARTVYALLALLVALELFAVNMDNHAVFAPVPPARQLDFSPPPLVARALEDTDTPFRVDGNYRDLYGNYASLYGLMDIRGISPLFLEGPHTLIQTNEPVNPRAWEIFAVRYVFSDWNELPVASEIVLSAADRFGAANLHRLCDPRPFAWLVYDAQVVNNDEAAYALLAQPDFDARRTVILNRDAGITLSGQRPENAQAVVTAFAPEAFTIEVSTPAAAILTVAQPDYPGWRVLIDGQPADLLRAYGAVVALALPAGQHTVEFVYEPLSFRLGALISLLTWGALLMFAVGIGIRYGRH